MPELMAMYPAGSAIRREAKKMAKLRKSGEVAGKTGEYEEVGTRGGKLPDGKTVTIDDKADRIPPAQEKGRKYVRKGPPKK